MARLLLVFGIALAATALVACPNDAAKHSQDSRHSVVVTAFDPDWKIRAIKALRAETGLGLADAKRLIDEAPSVVKTQLTQSEANALATRLRAQGMTIEIQDE